MILLLQFVANSGKLLLALLVGFAVTGGVAKASTQMTEIELLNKIPRAVLDHLAFDARPDPKGAMQLNVGGWHSVVYQRIAMPLIWTGAVEDDTAKIDDGWRAVDLAFAHQLSDGSFETADGKTTAPSDMSFWLEAVCHALLVVEDSSLRNHYQSRIDALKPKMARAAAWLAKPTNREKLFRGDYFTDNFFASNRLLVDASAFIASSRLLGDAALLPFARRFLNDAIERQRADGTLPENGGFDSSYQSVSLLHGTYYALRDPSAPLHEALQKGLLREVRAVDASSGALDVSKNTRTAGQEKVFGQVKTPDYRSVILGLYYAGTYLNDDGAVQAAQRVYRRTFHADPNG